MSSAKWGLYLPTYVNHRLIFRISRTPINYWSSRKITCARCILTLKWLDIFFCQDIALFSNVVLYNCNISILKWSNTMNIKSALWILMAWCFSSTKAAVATVLSMCLCFWGCVWVNTLRPRQNGRHFPDNIFKWIFLNENVWISINISLKFVPRGPINNIPTLVQVMAWRRPGDKPLSEPMMVRLPTHICVTQAQWVKSFKLTLPHICWISWHSHHNYATNMVHPIFFKMLTGDPHLLACMYGGCFINVSRALRNILSKFCYCRNHTSYENFKLKLCGFGHTLKPCYGHTCTVSAWNSRHKCDFWHCIFPRAYFGQLMKD